LAPRHHQQAPAGVSDASRLPGHRHVSRQARDV
jgi:hypothetical protein